MMQYLPSPEDIIAALELLAVCCTLSVALQSERVMWHRISFQHPVALLRQPVWQNKSQSRQQIQRNVRVSGSIVEDPATGLQKHCHARVGHVWSVHIFISLHERYRPL
jgi:hypothetical protein